MFLYVQLIIQNIIPHPVGLPIISHTGHIPCILIRNASFIIIISSGRESRIIGKIRIISKVFCQIDLCKNPEKDLPFFRFILVDFIAFIQIQDSLQKDRQTVGIVRTISILHRRQRRHPDYRTEHIRFIIFNCIISTVRDSDFHKRQYLMG